MRLEVGVRQVLERRLATGHGRPLAIAFSGGGDSLALLLLTHAWARAAGRSLIVLTVDHRIRADSRDWTLACAQTARRLGLPFRALRWEGDKPAAGLPAAARAARHQLLAQAAREAGAAVILMGHTADDVLESRQMRREGATTPEPREWAPSPAWPQGRGVFVLRPLLGQRRLVLRDWLSARGEVWIEDPGNADPRFSRTRARRVTLQDPGPVPLAEDQPAGVAVCEEAGILTLERGRLRGASLREAQRVVSAAAVCAGGGTRRPAGDRVARATEALRGDDRVVAVLAGARLEADAGVVRVFREAGEAARGGLAEIDLTPGQAQVWDGRFEITAARRPLRVRRLAGLSSRLPKDQRRRLAELPAAARGAFPALVDPSGAVSCAVLTGECRSLVGERLRAAIGLVTREPPLT